MSWTDGIDDGGFGEFGGGYAGSPVDASVSGFGADLDGSYGGGVSVSGPVGPVGPSSEGSADAWDESNPTNPAGGRPTANFNTATLTGAMKSAASWAGNLLSNFSPMQNAMQWGVSMLPEQMRAQTRTMSLDELAAGMQAMGPSFNMQPGIIQSSQSGRMNVPMSGSGAHLGIASNVIDIGGKNVHVGPGMRMSEDFFPGYGTNPFSGVAMADPGEHKNYIRKKKRGTEIAAMIGP